MKFFKRKPEPVRYWMWEGRQIPQEEFYELQAQKREDIDRRVAKWDADWAALEARVAEWRSNSQDIRDWMKEIKSDHSS